MAKEIADALQRALQCLSFASSTSMLVFAVQNVLMRRGLKSLLDKLRICSIADFLVIRIKPFKALPFMFMRLLRLIQD